MMKRVLALYIPFEKPSFVQNVERDLTMQKYKGFTISQSQSLRIELIVVVMILSVLAVVGLWGVRGCGARMSEDMIVNALHSSTAKIRVLTTYALPNEAANIYRVYATVIEDSDYATPCESGVCPNETFEIEDSFIDGNYRTADIFGELRISEQSGRIFEVNLRGERSGVAGGGSFRQIHAMTAVEELEE